MQPKSWLPQTRDGAIMLVLLILVLTSLYVLLGSSHSQDPETRAWARTFLSGIGGALIVYISGNRGKSGATEGAERGEPDVHAGLAGARGPEGVRGPAGLPGRIGQQGPPGPQGQAGPEGPPGLEGAAGSQGPAGPGGPAGPRGLGGDPGKKGPSGRTGVPGLDGPHGEMGKRGPKGKPGKRGPATEAESSSEGIHTSLTGASPPPVQATAAEEIGPDATDQSLVPA